MSSMFKLETTWMIKTAMPINEKLNDSVGTEKVSLGDFLKQKRSELEKSQRQMGIQSGHLSQIESGKITEVSPFTLLELASAYQFSLSELVEAADVDEELVTTSRALLIGQAVMQLPASEYERIIDLLGHSGQKVGSL
jgi:transcriptional regulator with XRE-family HTH domain